MQGTVTRIIDGDTIDIDDKRIRFSLVNTPERGEPGYSKATAFTGRLCPVGSMATVDEDDGQRDGSHGRVIGVVHCNGHNLNAELVDAGHAEILERFCGTSEFSNSDWAIRNGC